jgi:hypothetical protein
MLILARGDSGPYASWLLEEVDPANSMPLNSEQVGVSEQKRHQEPRVQKQTGLGEVTFALVDP